MLTHVGTERTATPRFMAGILSPLQQISIFRPLSIYTVSGQRAGNDTDNGKAVALKNGSPIRVSPVTALCETGRSGRLPLPWHGVRQSGKAGA